MQTFLTDVHNHSTFSSDGVSSLSEMLKTAQEKGVAFYGVAEHFEYGENLYEHEPEIDAEEYFHSARHLQEDYAGVMNVLVGAEYGYTADQNAQGRYAMNAKKHRPDFAVNSVHMKDKIDYYTQIWFYTDVNGVRVLRDKNEVYREYLAIVKESLDVPYPYDIVGHLGYPARYAPYEDKAMRYDELAKEFDEVLLKIIEKGKILEVNAAGFFASEDVLKRYFELGGRMVSYASDAHSTQSILRNRAEIVAVLKKIGFTYVTVPCRGEYIKVDL